MQHTRTPLLDRRGFLKLGLAGSAVLGTVSLGAGLSGCHAREQAAAQGFGFFQDADLVLFTALAPVVLAGSLPAGAEERSGHIQLLLQRMDYGCGLLAPSARAELRKLLDLLNLGLTRRLAARVSRPWDQADAEQIDAFLQRWRDSSIGLFNAGYRALVALLAGAHYGTPAGWAASGYPGPPRWIVDALQA
ncbi:MAG: hypothetical protein ACLGHI_04240 [Gammaproteobacteria bacterium]